MVTESTYKLLYFLNRLENYNQTCHVESIHYRSLFTDETKPNYCVLPTYINFKKIYRATIVGCGAIFYLPDMLDTKAKSVIATFVYILYLYENPRHVRGTDNTKVTTVIEYEKCNFILCEQNLQFKMSK